MSCTSVCIMAVSCTCGCVVYFWLCHVCVLGYDSRTGSYALKLQWYLCEMCCVIFSGPAGKVEQRILENIESGATRSSLIIAPHMGVFNVSLFTFVV